MAKKKAAAKTAPKKGGGPQKACPSCGASVHSATMTCPHCEHKFPPRNTGGGTKRAPATSGGKSVMASLDLVLEFASIHGGISEAIGKLEDAIVMVEEVKKTGGTAQEVIDVLRKIEGAK